MLPISPLQLSQLDAAAETAAAAFYSYPMFTAYFPNPEQRRWKTRWYVRNAIKIALEYGDVQATQDLQGIAFALPPEHTHLPVSVFIRSGYWKAPLVLGLRDFYRSQACEEAVSEAHTRWMQTQPHYYLWGLTVHPQAQGRGYGKALLSQLLKKANMKGVIFIPTGLMDNPGYLSWEKVKEMNNSGNFYFGNHTWSHRNVGGSLSVVEYEAKTADTQLADRGLNLTKVFAYPYGIENGQAVKLLKDMGYKLAFTTVYGRTQCEKKRFDLPRIRIGNAPLSSYGL